MISVASSWLLFLFFVPTVKSSDAVIFLHCNTVFVWFVLVPW